MQNIIYRGTLVAVLTALLSTISTAVLAQSGGGGEQAQNQAGDLDRDRTRDQLRTKIDDAPGLDEGQRARMRANLDACLNLGVPAANLSAVFPDGKARQQVSAIVLLELQNRVMTMARDGMTVEPMLAKAQEGRTKGVPEPALERACTRMEQQVRTANRVMAGFAQAGIDPPVEPAQNRRMQGEVAQHMWRGINEADYDQLREQARERRRDGDCNADDVVAAGEVTARLLEAGVAHQRAVDFAGAALKQGYRYQEMRDIQMIVAARYHRGEPMDDLLGGMERCVGAGMGPGEMYGYMIRHGWMGPGDMYGPGGHQPTDPKGHGGGHDGGGGNDDRGNRHGDGSKP